MPFSVIRVVMTLALDNGLFGLRPPAGLRPLAEDFEGQTMPFPVDSKDIRVYVGSGVLISRFALIMAFGADGAIEVLDVEFG